MDVSRLYLWIPSVALSALIAALTDIDLRSVLTFGFTNIFIYNIL